MLEAYFKLTVTFGLDVFPASENVTTLVVNVAEIVQCGHVCHGHAVGDALPGGTLDVLAILDGVFLHLLHVSLFSCAVAASNALIVASFQHISLLEGSKEWLLLLRGLLFGECDVCAIGCEARVEAASLANSVGPGLVSVENLRVLFSVLITAHILSTLIGVERVANPIEVGDRVSFDACGKARSTLRSGTSRRAKRDVLELRLANQLVATSDEWLGLLRGRATLAHDILARILEGISKSVAGKGAKCLLVSLALVDGHTFVESDLMTLLAESLVASARVTNSQTDGHGEKSVALAINKIKERRD